MSELRTLTQSVAAIMVIVAGSISVGAQDASPVGQSASITVSVAFEHNHFVVGQTPFAILTVKNMTDEVVSLRTGVDSFRIHVTGEKGEPPQTEFHRHLHGDFRPGDGPNLSSGSGVAKEMEPGASQTMKFDLAAYYDLSTPGKYSVYIEVLDAAPPTQVRKWSWLRTNTAHFEIQPPTQ
jgi:hypothetical protein